MITFRLIKIIGIILLIVAIVGVLVVVVLPSSAYMERSMIMKAPPDIIYRELVSFRNFKVRSPWAVNNQEAKYTVGGPAAGVGAHISWESGNEDMRSGRIEIIDVLENQYVVSKMSFEGYGSNPSSKWMLTPIDSGTMVTWAFEEKDIKGFNKVFMLGIDGFLGNVYEQGLKLLKERVEAAPQSPYQICIVEVKSTPYLGIDDFSIADNSILSTRMYENFSTIERYIDQENLQQTGSPFTVYSTLSDSDVLFTNGIPVSSGVYIADESIFYKESYGGLAVKASYMGDYEFMMDVHNDIKDYIAFYNYEQNGNIWEEYPDSSLGKADSSHWKMSVYYPVK